MSSVLISGSTMHSISRACRAVLLLLGFAGINSSLFAQSQTVPTAEQVGDLYVGVSYIRAAPDYSPHTFNGFGIFSDFDFSRYFGVEAEFDHSSGAVPVTISENTFGIGLRARYQYRDFVPYLKLMGGLGRFSAGVPSQDGSYAMYAGGGGLEYRLPRKFSVRADYEYQRWSNFPPRGLQPNLTSVGVAYRIR